MEIIRDKSPNDLIWNGDGFVKRNTLDVKPMKKQSKKQKRKMKLKAKYSEIYFAKEQKKAVRNKKWYSA